MVFRKNDEIQAKKKEATSRMVSFVGCLKLLQLLFGCFEQAIDIGTAQSAIEESVTRLSIFAEDVAAMVGTNVSVKSVADERFNDTSHIEASVFAPMSHFAEGIMVVRPFDVT